MFKFILLLWCAILWHHALITYQIQSFLPATNRSALHLCWYNSAALHNVMFCLNALHRCTWCSEPNALKLLTSGSAVFERDAINQHRPWYWADIELAKARTLMTFHSTTRTMHPSKLLCGALRIPAECSTAELLCKPLASVLNCRGWKLNLRCGGSAITDSLLQSARSHIIVNQMWALLA
jgi:hypothetical protein